MNPCAEISTQTLQHHKKSTSTVEAVSLLSSAEAATETAQPLLHHIAKDTKQKSVIDG